MINIFCVDFTYLKLDQLVYSRMLHLCKLSHQSLSPETPEGRPSCLCSNKMPIIIASQLLIYFQLHIILRMDMDTYQFKEQNIRYQTQNARFLFSCFFPPRRGRQFIFFSCPAPVVICFTLSFQMNL